MRATCVLATLFVLANAAACGPSHPGGGDGDADGDGDGDGDSPGVDAGPGSPDAGPVDQEERSCATTFKYTAPTPATTVEVAGQWDWDARTPLGDPDGDGVWTTALDLPAGFHAYKLIVDGTWILDPGSPWRKYDGGVENSGVRVGDCRDPELELLEVEHRPGGLTARVRVWRGNGGPALQASDLAATRRKDFTDEAAPVVSLEDGLATISVDGLPAGKHTVTVFAQDDAGRAATPLRLPFWIESAADPAQAFDWRGEPIYMVMIDRFRNGNPGNDPAPQAAAAPTADFFGGDLAGVTAAIEDGTFDALGIKVLWLSPFVENAGGVHQDKGHGVTGYHGYWPIDGRAVDARFGTPEELEALVVAAHARGMRVLMDYVINHIHEDHPYRTDHPEWFRTGCVCGTDGCGWTERRLDCLFHPYMPDVDWSNPEAGDQFVADALWWLERFDLDGLRVDAVKHVEDLAILHLREGVRAGFEQAGTHYFLLGETAMGWAGDDLAANLPEYQTISRYVGPRALTGQFDFVLYHAVAYRVFADAAKGFLHLDYWTKTSQEQYPTGSIMTPFVGSHDSQRIVTLAQFEGKDGIAHHKWPEEGLPPEPTTDAPYEKAALALTWVLTLPGAPLLYYGDEYGEHGGSDPDNRHMWRAPAERSARQAAMYGKLAAVLAARRASEALRRGGYRTVAGDEDVLVFARETATDFALVGLSRSDAPAQRTIAVPQGATQVKDALAGPAAPALPVAAGEVVVTIPARGAVILVPVAP